MHGRSPTFSVLGAAASRPSLTMWDLTLRYMTEFVQLRCAPELLRYVRREGWEVAAAACLPACVRACCALPPALHALSPHRQRHRRGRY